MLPGYLWILARGFVCGCSQAAFLGTLLQTLLRLAHSLVPSPEQTGVHAHCSKLCLQGLQAFALFGDHWSELGLFVTEQRCCLRSFASS